MSRPSAQSAVLLILLSVFVSAMARAQENSTQRLASLDSSVSSSRSGLAVMAPAARRRVTDRPFWTMLAVTTGSAIMDGETTMRGLQSGRVHEMNPLLGAHPGRPRFYATVGATDAALAVLSWQLKKTAHEKLWRAPLLGATAVHVGGAINNLRY